jgi:hypothetical protein
MHSGGECASWLAVGVSIGLFADWRDICGFFSRWVKSRAGWPMFTAGLMALRLAGLAGGRRVGFFALDAFGSGREDRDG